MVSWSKENEKLQSALSERIFCYNKFKTGCSIPAVRAHGVGVDWVRFPASRLANLDKKIKNLPRREVFCLIQTTLKP